MEYKLLEQSILDELVRMEQGEFNHYNINCELDENEIRKLQEVLRYSFTYDKHLHELEKYCKLKHPGYAIGRPAITRFHKDLIGREIILTQKIENKVEYYFSDPNQGSIEFKKE